jgi:polynucleotide 5'-hydroxyl-kinase GRC3/NOL9
MLDEEVLDIAIRERILFVMGEKDTGKSTIVRELANELFRRGFSIGIIDADVGQSDIGPPTTIGLGTVESALENLGDVVLQHFYFVGSTSPKGHLLSIIIGVRKMLDKACECGLQKIIFDTTGLVAGQLGRILKEYKIATIDPDVIVCLQTNHECEHILQLYDSFEKPIVLRLTPDSQCRKRTVTERRNYRETAFQKYFAYAKDIECFLSEIGIFGTPLFSGQPLSRQHLQELSNTLQLKNTETTDKETEFQVSSFKFQIFWGEYLGKELLLVTSYKLGYEHFINLKQCCPDITYVRNYTIDEFENTLVGILNKNGNFCALGILRTVDFANSQAVIHTPADQQDIAGLKFSKHIMHAA